MAPSSSPVNQVTLRPKKLKIFNGHKNKEKRNKFKERLWKWQVIQGSICYKVLKSPSIYKVLLVRSQKCDIGNTSSSESDVCAFYGSCHCDRFKDSKFKNFVLKKFSHLNLKNVKMCCLKKPKSALKNSMPTVSQKAPCSKTLRCKKSFSSKNSVVSIPKSSNSESVECSEHVSDPEALLVMKDDLTDMMTCNDIGSISAVSTSDKLFTDWKSIQEVPESSLVTNSDLTSITSRNDTDFKSAVVPTSDELTCWNSTEEVSEPSLSMNLSSVMACNDTDSKSIVPSKRKLFANLKSIEQVCSSNWYSFISQGNRNNSLHLTRVLTSFEIISKSQYSSSTVERISHKDPDNSWRSLMDTCTSTWHTFMGHEGVFPEEICSLINAKKQFKEKFWKRISKKSLITESIDSNISQNHLPMEKKTLKDSKECIDSDCMNKSLLASIFSKGHSLVDESAEKTRLVNCPESNLNAAMDNSSHVYVPYRSNSVNEIGELPYNSLDESLKLLNGNHISPPINSRNQEDMEIDEGDLVTDIEVYSTEGCCTNHVTSETVCSENIRLNKPHSPETYQKCTSKDKIQDLQRAVIKPVIKSTISESFRNNLLDFFCHTPENYSDLNKEIKFESSTAKMLNSNHMGNSQNIVVSSSTETALVNFHKNKLPSPFPRGEVALGSCDINPSEKSKENSIKEQKLCTNQNVAQKDHKSKGLEVVEKKLSNTKRLCKSRWDPPKTFEKEIKCNSRERNVLNSNNRADKSMHADPKVKNTENMRPVSVKNKPLDLHNLPKMHTEQSEVARTERNFVKDTAGTVAISAQKSIVKEDLTKSIEDKICDPRLDANRESKCKEISRPMLLKRVKWGFKRKRPKEKSMSSHSVRPAHRNSISNQVNNIAQSFEMSSVRDPRLKKRLSAETGPDRKNLCNEVTQKKDLFSATFDLRVLNYPVPAQKKHPVEPTFIESCESTCKEKPVSNSKTFLEDDDLRVKGESKANDLNSSPSLLEKRMYPKQNTKHKYRHKMPYQENDVAMVCTAGVKGYEKTMFNVHKNKVSHSTDRYRPNKHSEGSQMLKYSKCKCARKIRINIESQKECHRCWLHRHRKRHDIQRHSDKSSIYDKFPYSSTKVSDQKGILMDNLVSSTTDTTEVPLSPAKLQNPKLLSFDSNKHDSAISSFSINEQNATKKVSSLGKRTEINTNCNNQLISSQESTRDSDKSSALSMPTLSTLEKNLTKRNIKTEKNIKLSSKKFDSKSFHSEQVSKISEQSILPMSTLSTINKDAASQLQHEKKLLIKYLNRKAVTSEKSRKHPEVLVNKNFARKSITPKKSKKNLDCSSLSMPSLAAIEQVLISSPIKNQEYDEQCFVSKNVTSKHVVKALEFSNNTLNRSHEAVTKKSKIFDLIPQSLTKKGNEHDRAMLLVPNNPEAITCKLDKIPEFNGSNRGKSDELIQKSGKHSGNKALIDKQSVSVVQNSTETDERKSLTSKKSISLVNLDERTEAKVSIGTDNKSVADCSNKNSDPEIIPSKTKNASQNQVKSSGTEALQRKKLETTTLSSSISYETEVRESEKALENLFVDSEKNNDLLERSVKVSTNVNNKSDSDNAPISSTIHNIFCDNFAHSLDKNKSEGNINTKEDKNEAISEKIQCIKSSDDTLPGKDFLQNSNHAHSEIKTKFKEEIHLDYENEKLQSPGSSNNSIVYLQNSSFSVKNKSVCSANTKNIKIEQNVTEQTSRNSVLKHLKTEDLLNMPEQKFVSDINSCNAVNSVVALQPKAKDENVQCSGEKLSNKGTTSETSLNTFLNNQPMPLSVVETTPVDNRTSDVKNCPSMESFNPASLSPGTIDINYWNYLSSELFNSLLDSSVPSSVEENVSIEGKVAAVVEVGDFPTITDSSKACMKFTGMQDKSSYVSVKESSGFHAVLPKSMPVVSVKDDLMDNYAKHNFTYSGPINVDVTQISLQKNTRNSPIRSNNSFPHSPGTSGAAPTRVSFKSNDFSSFEPKSFICSIDHSDGSKCNMSKSFKANCCYSDKPFPCNVTFSFSNIKIDSTNLFEENGIFDLYYKHLKQTGTHVVVFDKLKSRDELDADSREAFDFLYGQLCYQECVLRGYVHKASEPGTACDMNLINKISTQLNVIQGYRLACKALLL